MLFAEDSFKLVARRVGVDYFAARVEMLDAGLHMECFSHDARQL
jgi:hypothetical protein